MGRYRKLPVIVEGRQLTQDLDEARELAKWCHGLLWIDGIETPGTDIPKINVHTWGPDGLVVASPGDWIIEILPGVFDPCKPEIFEQTYELVQ